LPRKLPPHVEVWRDRHGRQRVYFRRGKGPRIPLPPIGSPKFEEAYAAALASNVAAQREQPCRDEPGTIGALIVSYYRSQKFHALRDSSKKNYREVIEKIREAHGHRRLGGMTRSRIITKILEPYADRPRRYRIVLAMLRVLIRRAIEIEWLKDDLKE
jgi:enterobacteria phage integrase